jgi:hypothetical protein
MILSHFILGYKPSDADSAFTCKVEIYKQMKRVLLPSAKPLLLAKSVYRPTLFIFQPALCLHVLVRMLAITEARRALSKRFVHDGQMKQERAFKITYILT